MVEDKIYTAFLEKENRRLNDKVVELTKMHTVNERVINDLQNSLIILHQSKVRQFLTLVQEHFTKEK